MQVGDRAKAFARQYNGLAEDTIYITADCLHNFSIDNIVLFQEKD